MQPVFDDYDAGIVSERQKARRKLGGPLQGDFIQSKDGQLARITHVWDDSVQTTKFSDYGDGGSFHLSSSGHMSYSGGLEPGVKRSHIRDTNTARAAKCWIFHHGHSAAHNGVDCEIFVTVWKMLDDSEAVNRDIPARYIVAPDEKYNGGLQTVTYTTYDGVERAAYRDGQTAAAYLEENADCIIMDEAQYAAHMKSYYDAQKTKPKEISEERYEEMLNVLPPCRWTNGRFHISERLTGNIVTWFCQKDGKFYEFDDDAALSDDELAAIIAAI